MSDSAALGRSFCAIPLGASATEPSVVRANTISGAAVESRRCSLGRTFAALDNQLVTGDWRNEGKRDEEGRPGPDLALRPDDAALCFDDPLGDEEAQPAPLAGSFVRLPVALKQMGQPRRRNPGAGVPDGHQSAGARGGRRKDDGPSFGDELDGV